MAKVAIAVFADTETHGDLGRIANALTTARELKAANDDITIIFDGAGTKWVRELAKPDHRLHGAFESASCNAVIRRLQDQGYAAIAAANPLRGGLRRMSSP